MSCRLWVVVAMTTVLVLTTGACSARPVTVGAPEPGCITDFDPAVDYFPDKSSVTDATNFALSYHNSYQVLTVNAPYPNGRSESYVLVRCGAPAPELTGELSGAQQIPVPIAEMYSASTTQLAMIAELDRAEVVTGVANTADVVSPPIRDRIDAGAIAGYAPSHQINAEAVIAAAPDVLVAGGSHDPSHAKLRDAGIGVVADAEWLETTPLGRAEWIKVLAALTGSEKTAATAYGKIRDRYNAIAVKTAGASRVEVLPGTMHQGTWSMPAGGDYAARFIRDAGGIYPWADSPRTGSQQLNFESVYAKAGQLPLWLVTSDWNTTDDALADDRRYGQLAALGDGQVWSATKAVGPGGGNDYWERGVAHPELVLGDLVAILHPELAVGHDFEFYRQVPRP